MTKNEKKLCVFLVLFLAVVVGLGIKATQHLHDLDEECKKAEEARIKFQMQDINAKSWTVEYEEVFQVLTRPEPVSGLSHLKKVYALRLSDKDYMRTVFCVFTEKEYPIGTRVRIAEFHSIRTIYSPYASEIPIIIMKWK